MNGLSAQGIKGGSGSSTTGTVTVSQVQACRREPVPVWVIMGVFAVSSRSGREIFIQADCDTRSLRTCCDPSWRNHNALALQIDNAETKERLRQVPTDPGLQRSAVLDPCERIILESFPFAQQALSYTNEFPNTSYGSMLSLNTH